MNKKLWVGVSGGTSELPQSISLETFSQVWEFELQEIHDHIEGKNPDSLLNKLNESYHKVGRKLGDSSEPGKSTFFESNDTLRTILGTVGVVTGTTGLIFTALAAAQAVDSLNEYEVAEKAETTERLLKYAEQPVSLINWDLCSSLIQNIESWLLPKLAIRIKSLTEVLSISSDAAIAKERLDLYLKAVSELEVALKTLKSWDAAYNATWNSDREAYLHYENSIQEEYELEKKKLQLVGDALLIDKAEYVTRIRDADDKLENIKCSNGKCDHIRIENSAFCFFHTCYADGCNLKAKKEKHFCKEHIKHISDSSLETENASSGKHADASSESKKSIFTLVAFASLVILVIILLRPWNEPHQEESVAPPPAIEESVDQPPAIVAKPATPRPESAMMAQVESLHGVKSFADWSDIDMVKVVEILAKPKTQVDRDALEENEEFYKTADCVGSGCLIQKREFEAAKLLREGKVKTAYEALGISPSAQPQSEEIANNLMDNSDIRNVHETKLLPLNITQNYLNHDQALLIDAATHNDLQAFLTLAEMYRYGIKVKVNRQISFTWYKIALVYIQDKNLNIDTSLIEQGLKSNSELNQMSPSQIDEAVNKANLWKENWAKS